MKMKLSYMLVSGVVMYLLLEWLFLVRRWGQTDKGDPGGLESSLTAKP